MSDPNGSNAFTFPDQPQKNEGPTSQQPAMPQEPVPPAVPQEPTAPATTPVQQPLGETQPLNMPPAWGETPALGETQPMAPIAPAVNAPTMPQMPLVDTPAPLEWPTSDGTVGETQPLSAVPLSNETQPLTPMAPLAQPEQPTATQSLTTQPLASQPTTVQPTVSLPTATQTTMATQPIAPQPTVPQPTVPQPTMAMPIMAAQQPTAPLSEEQPTQVFHPLDLSQFEASQQMPPVIPPSMGDDDAPAGDHDDPSASHGKLSGGAIAGIVIAALVVIALIVGGVFWMMSRNNNKTELATCNSEQVKYEKAMSALTERTTSANQVASQASGQVADATTLDTLNAALADAGKLSVNAQCSAEMSSDDLKKNAQSFRDGAKEADSLATTLKQSSEAVEDSKTQLQVNNLKQDLSAAINTAQQALNDSAGKVSDEATRTALQDAITNANNVFAKADPSDADVSNAKSQLEKAQEDVQADVTAKQQADAAEAARRAQEEAERKAKEEEERRRMEQESGNAGDEQPSDVDPNDTAGNNVMN